MALDGLLSLATVTSLAQVGGPMRTALATGAIIHPISLAEGNFSFPYSKSTMIVSNMECVLTWCLVPLLLNGIGVQGSVVASRYVYNCMLDFAEQHKIEPIIEKFPMTEEAINEAMNKLLAPNTCYK